MHFEGGVIGSPDGGERFRQKVEFRLADGEGDRRYRQVFENSSDALFIVDVSVNGELRFNSVNAAAEEAFGLPAAMLRGLSFREVVDGRLGAHFGAALIEHIDDYVRCVCTGMPQGYEGSLDLLPERRGGRRRFRVQLLPLAGDAGIERIIGIGHDVTLRAQYESELRQRARLEEQLSALAATVPGFLFTFRATADGRGCFPFASPGVKDLFGLRPEDIRNDAAVLHTSYHPEDRPKVLRSMEEAILRAAPFRLECRVIHPDKGVRWVEMRAVPHHGPDGAVECHGLMIDVTARKRAEADSRRRELEFHTLAENSPDVVLRFDRECRLLYASPAYETVAGIAVADVLGKTPVDLAAAPDIWKRAMQAMLKKVIETRAADEIELAWRGEDDAFVAYDIRAVPEFDASGNVFSVLSVARDISALKETQVLLLESRTRLQQLSVRREEAREEERKRIARDLHEELGQLLTALRMRISTLPLQYGEALSGLRENTDAMVALVDRAIQGMRDVISSLRPTALDAGIAVGLEWLADEFTKHSGVGCRLRLPGQRLDLNETQATGVFRIVQESLTNIARHAGASQVEIVLERAGERWRVEVRDDGRGCPAHKPSGRSFGILGMSERALMLGGEFHIARPTGGGTVVGVTFPARQRDDAPGTSASVD